MSKPPQRDEPGSECALAAERLFRDSSPRIEASLMHHVVQCGDCRAQVEAHRALASLRNTPAPQLAAGFSRRVTHLAAATQTMPMRFSTVLLEGAYAAAGVLAFAWLLTSTGGGLPAPRVPAAALPWLVPAGFAAAMALQAIARALQAKIARLLAA